MRILIFCGIIILWGDVNWRWRNYGNRKKLTQTECAEYLGIPVRTYQNYETDESKKESMKYLFMVQKLEEYGFIDETHGILPISRIKDICSEVFSDFEIEYC